MKDIIKFLLFISYTVCIFFIDNPVVLTGIFLVNIILMFVCKVNFRKAIRNLLAIGIFVAFAMIVNFIAMSLKDAVLVGVKLLLVCNITYTFSRVMSPMKMTEVLQKLLTPARIAGLDTSDLGIIICLAIAFIPIFKSEMAEVLMAMRAKCIKVGFKNLHLVVEPMLIGALKRTNDIEMSLKAKGYR